MGRRKSISVGGQWLTPASALAGPVTVPAAPVAVPAPSPIPNGSPPPLPNLPPAMGGSMIDPLSSAILWLNTNPYLIGMLMLLLNLGGRYLTLELTKKQEAFLQAPWTRVAIFFTVIFIATRNLVAAFWVTLAFFFVIWIVANENSPFCMIPNWCGHDTKTPAELYEANVAALKSYF